MIKLYPQDCTASAVIVQKRCRWGDVINLRLQDFLKRSLVHLEVYLLWSSMYTLDINEGDIEE